MKIIYNKYIPLKGFTMLNLFGVLFVRSDINYTPSEVGINHERIHTAQIIECAILSMMAIIVCAACSLVSWWWLLTTPFSFYIAYVLSWVVQVILPPYDKAYLDIAFECEAKDNAAYLDYISSRVPFSWLKYIFDKI